MSKMKAFMPILFIVYTTIGIQLGNATHQEFNETSGGGKVGVVDGHNASLGSVPWQGLMQISGRSDVCGCSLIGARWALSAAHCTYGVSSAEITLYFGIINRNDLSTSGQRFSVIQLINNPGYINNGEYLDDISLLKLDREATLNDDVKVITLPPQDYVVPNGTMCTISGWGSTRSGGPPSTILQMATVPALSNPVCRQRISPKKLPTIYPGWICAGYEEGGVDTCQGDSGGPLACPTSVGSSHFVLQGVTSFGFNCATTDPGVYTRVSSFTHWISLVGECGELGGLLHENICYFQVNGHYDFVHGLLACENRRRGATLASITTVEVYKVLESFLKEFIYRDGPRSGVNWRVGMVYNPIIGGQDVTALDGTVVSWSSEYWYPGFPGTVRNATRYQTYTTLTWLVVRGQPTSPWQGFLNRPPSSTKHRRALCMIAM